MTVNVDNLTVMLADRLAAILPAGFHIQASNGMLWYSADEGRFPGQSGDYHVGQAGTDVRTNFGSPGQNDADNIVRVAVLALDGLQDYIDEATHDPWPGTRTPPRPQAQIRGSMLHLWYGEHGNAVLACEPIPLAGISPLADPLDGLTSANALRPQKRAARKSRPRSSVSGRTEYDTDEFAEDDE